TSAGPREVEVDDLEHALAAPGVDVADVAELRDDPPGDAGLLEPLAERCLGRLLALGDEPFGKRPDALRLALRPYRCEPVPAPHPSHQHEPGGDFAARHYFVTPRYEIVTRFESARLKLAWRDALRVLWFPGTRGL